MRLFGVPSGAAVSALLLAAPLAGQSTQVDTATVNVVPTIVAVSPAPTPTPSPGSAGSHEPAGYSRITDNTFSVRQPAGWRAPFGANPGAYYTITSDTTAPESPPSVGQVEYPAGFGAGNGPAADSYHMQALGYTKLYISEWIKFSSNFYGNGAANKLGYLWQNVNGRSHNDIYWSAQGAGTGPIHLEVHYQGTAQGTGNLKPNAGTSGDLARGAWHHIEMLFVSNAGGSANGIVRWWVDGALVGDYTTFKYVSASDSGVWKTFTWTSIWGGTNGSVPAAMYYWMDEYYASGAP